MNKTSSCVIINSYLRACTADLANVTVMELRLLGRPFGLLQLALVKRRLLIGVSSRSRHHVAARIAPGRARQRLGWRLDGGLGLLGLLWLLGRRLRLGKGLLRRLVIGGGGCGGVASWVITGVVNACGWGRRVIRERKSTQDMGHLWAVRQVISCTLISPDQEGQRRSKNPLTSVTTCNEKLKLQLAAVFVYTCPCHSAWAHTFVLHYRHSRGFPFTHFSSN